VDVGTRQPRRLQRLKQERAGSTGLIVHGRYNRLPGWGSEVGWNAITVQIDGVPRGRVYQVVPGPLWFELDAGPHLVEFIGTHRAVRSEWIKLAEGEAVMIAFKPRERMPFRRRATPEQWSMRQLW
jgi:hypothetical protein